MKKMEKRPSCRISGLKYPARDNIKSRLSTLVRSMASTLAPRIPCTQEMENTWKGIFCDDEGNLKCAYCGADADHLDHLFPLIDGTFLTGYGTEPGNLVPCCSSCNQSKGNKKWEDYIKGLPVDEEIKNAGKEKITRLLESNLKPKPKDYENEEFHREWNGLRKELNDVLERAQQMLEKYK